MDRISHLLAEIAKAKSDHSNSSLKNPRQGVDPSFEYGRVTGFYQGLCQVESFINNILKEDDDVKSSRR